MAIKAAYLSFPPFRLEIATGALWRGKRRLHLKPQTAKVLLYLVERSGQLVSKTALLAALWPDITVSDGVLKTSVWEIRRVLADQQQPSRFIETIPRKGYRFLRSVQSSQPAPSSPSLTSPSHLPLASIVGRDAELTQLYQALTNACAGERQIVFVTGEPGIGKTTLVDTFLRQVATQPQVDIAPGQCIEHSGTSEAYLPVLTALGRLSRAPDGKSLLSLLRQYAPTWLVQMPGLLTPTERKKLEWEVRGATRGRMLREFAEAVEASAATQTLILWLEDLHWSDASTVDLLSFLAARSERAQLLIIGSYRPVDILRTGHPLRAIVQEILTHKQGKELPVNPLSPTAIKEYLTGRFRREKKECVPSDASLQDLSQALYQHTEGNPLFMVEIMDYLLAQGTLTTRDGHWRLQNAAAHVRNGVPPHLQQLIAWNIERVDLASQRILEVASVVGAEFSAAAVAAGLGEPEDIVEEFCTELARRALFLRFAGSNEWPDGTVTSRYGFLHALYQHVLYERLPIGQRVRLHQRIGERIEYGYGLQAREVAAELAVHFEQGRNFSRAVHYLRQAGENATRRSAHGEAVRLFSKGLTLLRRLPLSTARLQHESRLQLALGAPLITLKGYASAEVEGVYSRARALCQYRRDTRTLFPAILGLCGVRHNQAKFRQARALAQQLLHLTENGDDTTRQLWAHVLAGTVSYQMGNFARAQRDFTEGIALYDMRQHSPQMSDVIQDPGVHCHCYLAEILWLQGYADQARHYCRQALHLARQVAHAHSQAVALSSAVLLYTWLGELQIAQEMAEELVTLTQQQGFPQWFAVGAFRRGRILAQNSSVTEGIQQMQHALGAFRATGAKLWLPLFSCDLAWAYARAGQESAGLPLLAAAQTMMEKTGERFYAAELFRLKGELTLQQK